MYIYTYVCVCIYIYIYIYVYTLSVNNYINIKRGDETGRTASSY